MGCRVTAHVMGLFLSEALSHARPTRPPVSPHDILVIRQDNCHARQAQPRIDRALALAGPRQSGAGRLSRERVGRRRGAGTGRSRLQQADLLRRILV